MLFSAFIADGPPSRVLQEAVDSRIELVVPVFVLDELERVLAVELGFDEERVAAVRQLLERLATALPSRPEAVAGVTGDPGGDVVLACAVEAAADVLVMGDRKHLLPLKHHRGVRMLTPQALLAELRAAGA